MVLKQLLTLLLMVQTILFSYEGEGLGLTKQEAIYSALSDIASQVSISIDSTTTVNKRATMDSYSRDIQNMIHVELPKMVFQNYKILEQKKEKNQYFVKLKIDAKELASNHARILNRRLKLLKQKLNTYNSKVKKYGILKEANIEKMWLSLELLHAMDLTYVIDGLTKEIEQFTYDESRYLKELTFLVQSNNQEVQNIASTLLSHQGLIGSSKGAVVLKIAIGAVEKSNISGQYIGTAVANIKMIENGQLLLSRSLKLSATSVISEHYLMQKILQQFKEKLQTILEKVL